MGASLSTKPEPIPASWVDRMFQRFAGMYGQKWLSMWDGIPLDGVKAIWAEDLSGLTPDEIKRGMDACKSRTFPPTLPEFRGLCRPPLPESDAETMFSIAVDQMIARRNRQPENWPNNRLFWAAQRMGNELGIASWRDLAGRWKSAWMYAEADVNKPIPAVSDAYALPAPGKTTLTREESAKIAQEIGLKVRKDSPEQVCVRAVDAIAGNPKQHSFQSISYAVNALKFWRKDIPDALKTHAVLVGALKVAE